MEKERKNKVVYKLFYESEIFSKEYYKQVFNILYTMLYMLPCKIIFFTLNVSVPIYAKVNFQVLPG